MSTRLRLPQWWHLAMLVALVAGSIAPISSTLAQNDPDDGPAWINFDVRMCPDTITSFSGQASGEMLTNCTGDGQAGGEDPLAGGTIQLYDSLTGDVQWVDLDASGQAEVEVLAGHTYIATAYLGDTELTSKSLCGSAEYGLSGAIESGIWMGDTENLECDMLVLDPDAAANLPVTIEVKVGGCPAGSDASKYSFGDGMLDCNGDTSSDESQPFAGVKVKFTEVNTGLSYTHTSSNSGYVLADGLPAGTYTATATYNGAKLPLASVCGMSNADGTPLGLAGSLSDPQKLDAGFSLSCKALATLPGDPAVEPVNDFIMFQIKSCPPGTDPTTMGPDIGQAHHVLQCSDDLTFPDAPGFEGATITLTGLDNNSSATVTLNADGYGEANNLPADRFHAELTYNGQSVQWITDCSQLDSATKGPLNYSGSISASDSSQTIQPGYSANCLGMAVMPAATDAPAADNITFLLEYCPLDRDTSIMGPVIGGSNHVLDCNGDAEVKEALPYEGATITVTGINTGTKVTLTTDAGGNAKTDALPADSYKAEVSYNGKKLNWVTDCQSKEAASGTITAAWSISDAGKSIPVGGGYSLYCWGLAVLPATNADGKTPAATNGIELAFSVYECDQPLDWSQVTGAEVVNDDTINAVDRYFAGACTTPGTITGTFANNSAPNAQGDVTGTGSTNTFGPQFSFNGSPGGSIVFKETEPSGDFWLTCTFETPGTRSGNVLINNPLYSSTSPSFSVSIPTPGKSDGRCVIFHIPAAGTITHVVHFCNGTEVNRNDLTCDEAEIPIGFISFVGGSIFTDVPQSTSAFGTDSRVYAGQRWYIRDGFNRIWTYGVTADGSLVLSGQVPLGELSMGAGNIQKYTSDTVMVYCGSPSTGWVDSSVQGVESMMSNDGTWRAFEGSVSVGVNGAPNDVTCHWFIMLDSFQTPPVVKP